MDTHRNSPYPDLNAPEGLAAAMRDAARLRGCDIGRVSPTPAGVVTETARGFVSVEPAADGLFRMVVHIPDYAWVIGSADDLGRMVEAVAAWRQGVAYDALEARFEFLELGAFTTALESGEPARSQWASLLSADFSRPQWELLRRFRADETLRGFFPLLSHGAVRLLVDPLDAESRRVRVAEAEEGRYEVVGVSEAGPARVEVAAEDLIAYVRNFLTAR